MGERMLMWQVIVVQAKNLGRKPDMKVQTIIRYGDMEEGTQVAGGNQPLWNYWSQYEDMGEEVQEMEFLIVDTSDEHKSYEVGQVTLDLTQFRKKVSRSFDTWKRIEKDGKKLPGEIHLTITLESIEVDGEEGGGQRDCAELMAQCNLM